jgi:hypothetical protein
MDIRNWYWRMAGETERVFSSAAAAFVPVNDEGYSSWIAAGNTAPAAAAGDLYAYLSERAPDVALAAAPMLSAANLLPPDVVLAAKLAAGLTLVSTASPQINGTYSISDTAQTKMAAVYGGIKGGDGLPGGGASFLFLDINGVPRQFTADQFVALAKAARDYIYRLSITAAQLAAGQKATWPSATVAIA